MITCRDPDVVKGSSAWVSGGNDAVEGSVVEASGMGVAESGGLGVITVWKDEWRCCDAAGPDQIGRGCHGLLRTHIGLEI